MSAISTLTKKRALLAAAMGVTGVTGATSDTRQVVRVSESQDEQQAQQAKRSTAKQLLRAATAPAQRISEVAARVRELPPLQAERRVSKGKSSLVTGGPAIPNGYPSEQEWTSNTIPPGSKYTQEQWRAARVNDAGVECAVLEFQVPNKSWLMQIPKPFEQIVAEASGAVRKRIYPDGLSNIGDAIQQVFSDCIWVASTAYPQFPGASEATCVRDGIVFHVIRPRCDYTDPGKFWRTGATITVESSEENAEAEHEESIENQSNMPKM